MNIASYITIGILVILTIVVGGIVIVVYRASNRRPASDTTSTGIDFSIPLKLLLLVGFSVMVLYYSTITGWFVPEKTVNSLGRWLNPVFWVGAIGTLWLANSVFNLQGLLSSCSTALGGYRGRLLLIVAGGVLLYLILFTNLAVEMATYDFKTIPLGTALEPVTKEWTNVVIWGGLFLLVITALRLIFPKKKPVPGGTPVTIGDQIFMILGLTVFGGIAFVLGLVLLAVVDVFTDMRVSALGDKVLSAVGVIELDPRSTVECGQLEDRFGDSTDPRIGYEYVVVNVCPGDGQQYVRVEPGSSGLEFGFHQSELNTHDVALFSRGIDDFVVTRRLGPTSYYVFVKPDEFADLGVDHLKFVVRAPR